MQNPVVLFAHDHYQPAVGKVIELEKDGVGNLSGAIQFAAKEYDFAATLFRLYAAGFMRAFSVGFMNERYEIDQENDKVVLRENILYEISCVAVGANAWALAYGKGIDMKPLEKIMGERPERKEVELDTNKAVESISSQPIETIRSVIRTLTEVLKASGADNQVEKVETPAKGGNKKIPVAVINRAVRKLLAIKKSQ
jgi:HK97 family phage prohead protease